MLIVYANIEHLQKLSEGFSMFSVGNILQLIKAVRTLFKLNAEAGHLAMEKYVQPTSAQHSGRRQEHKLPEPFLKLNSVALFQNTNIKFTYVDFYFKITNVMLTLI